MDQLYPFNLTKEKKATVINPRTGCAGVLELHPVYGEVFIFRGSLTEKECEEQLAFKPIPGWDLMANSNHPSTVVWDGNQTSFTVFTWSEGGSAGFVKISEITCSCK